MSCTAIILAGGQGSRLDGQDKGLTVWRNKPLVAHCINALMPQVESLVISCNRNIDRYQCYGFPCFTDDNSLAVNRFQGPLAGVASCSVHITTDWVLLSPCDTPMLPHNLFSRLFNTLMTDPCQVVMARTDNQLHPSHALMSTEFATTAPAWLSQNNRSLLSWYDTTAWASCDFSDNASAFKNFNAWTDFL